MRTRAGNAAIDRIRAGSFKDLGATEVKASGGERDGLLPDRIGLNRFILFPSGLGRLDRAAAVGESSMD